MIEWNEGFAIGVKAIDDDHKNLLNIINKLSLAINNNKAQKYIEKNFDDLQDYAVDHFRREEIYIKKRCTSTQIVNHIKKHKEFEEAIPKLKEEVSNSTNSSTAKEVSAFLTDWLLNHIIEDIPEITRLNENDLYNENTSFLTKTIIKITNKFSFTKKILLSALIPLIGMLLFGSIILFHNFNQYKDMKKTSSITNIITNISELIHAIQIERGLSGGYLSSTKDKFKENIQVQRTVVDMATYAFLNKIKYSDIDSIPLMHPYIKTFKEDISSLNKFRKNIDSKLISKSEAMAKYTNIINNILNITPKVAFLSLDRGVYSSIATLSSVQHLKESLGQERASGTMIIEQKDATLKEYVTFTKLLGSQESFLSTFEQTANKEQKNNYDLLQKSKIAKQIKSYKNHIQKYDFNRLESVIWFKSMTIFINNIKLFEDELLSDINILVDKHINKTINNFLLWLIFNTTILLFTLSILYTLKKSTKFQIHQLTDAMKDLAQGGRSLRLSPIQVNRDELAYMYEAYETTRKKLLKGDIYTQLYLSKKELEIQKHQKENTKLEELAFIDPLTGALNRRKFEELSAQELTRSNRYNSDLSFLMLYIDHFKNINDTYGHAIGDEILKHFSSLCLEMARSLDIVARVGGEEFIIMLPETSSEGAHIFAERFREEVYASEVQAKDHIIKYSVSIGIATLDREKKEDVKDILHKADKALYQAKESGRNRSIIYK
ncbi:bacteriohemerythrin [Sulfurimonas sp.]|uniref:bacteriohemerythrin n=1 Tax=Sulfurimonas sp. TaxID=2022749 RepID=UPI0025D9227B|nr:bacteriohemerythrin [Sulfurimonas sp.]